MLRPLKVTSRVSRVVALALAHLARHVHVGKEVHLDPDRAVAPACLAASSLDVERETTGHVAAHPGLGRVGEQLSHMVEHAGVGGRVRPRGSPDGRLVDGDDLVEVADAVDAGVASRRGLGAVDVLHQRPVQDLVDQRRLARARHPGHAHEALQGDLHVDVGQIVLACAPDHQPGAVAAAADLRDRDLAAARQVLPGDGLLDFEEPVQRPGVHDAPAVLARAGADVDDVVGDADGLLVVLDHDHGVAEVAHAQERPRSGGGCRAGEGRWRARRARTTRPRDPSRPGWPAGSAGPRRRRGWPRCATESDSRGPRRAGTRAGPSPP